MPTELPKHILIASGNSGKVREFETLLLSLDIELIKLGRFPDIVEPDETGSSFRENAELKAAYYACDSNMWAMADDSGLEVDYLGGRPGVHSARYGGASTSYSDKIQLLLDELSTAADGERRAQFVSVIALSDPSGAIRVIAEGVCRGSIANAPRGSNGFGYDPIFVPEGFARTFGEMPDEEKRELSHRGRASIELIRKMSDFTGV